MSQLIEINQTYKLNASGLEFNKDRPNDGWLLPSHITVQMYIKAVDMYLVSLMSDDTITLTPNTIEDCYEPN